jgi:hypothetical protein
MWFLRYSTYNILSLFSIRGRLLLDIVFIISIHKIFSNVAEAIQSCCGGNTAVLQRIYSYVAEPIRVFISIIKDVLSFLGCGKFVYVVRFLLLIVAGKTERSWEMVLL